MEVFPETKLEVIAGWEHGDKSEDEDREQSHQPL